MCKVSTLICCNYGGKKVLKQDQDNEVSRMQKGKLFCLSYVVLQFFDNRSKSVLQRKIKYWKVLSAECMSEESDTENEKVPHAPNGVLK